MLLQMPGITKLFEVSYTLTKDKEESLVIDKILNLELVREGEIARLRIRLPDMGIMDVKKIELKISSVLKKEPISTICLIKWQLKKY